MYETYPLVEKFSYDEKREDAHFLPGVRDEVINTSHPCLLFVATSAKVTKESSSDFFSLSHSITKEESHSLISGNNVKQLPQLLFHTKSMTKKKKMNMIISRRFLPLLCVLVSMNHFATSSEVGGEDAVSFVDTGAFVKMDGFQPISESGWTGGSLSFRVKTSSQMAILFYSSGAEERSKQFVAVEVLNGKTSLSLNDGNGVVVLQSDVIVNDGLWHEVLVVFSPGYLEITVDGKQRTLQPNPGTKQFNLKNELFVGGIDSRHEYVALQQGLNTILSEGPESSLVGCIKEVRVNRKPISSKEFKGSKGVKFKGCYWDFVCLLQDPCLEDAECFQEGLNGFHCLCDHDICTRPNFNKSSESGYGPHNTQSGKIDSRHEKPRTTHKPKTSSTSASSITTQTVPISTLSPSPPTVMDIVRPNLTYLNIVITREQVIIGAYLVTVIFVLIIVGVLIREFYLLGRGRRRKKGHKTRDENCPSSGPTSSSPGTMTRCESSSHASHSPCLEMELDHGPPSTVSNLESNFGGSIDSRQPLTAGALLGVSSIYSRIEREKARRESLIYPLPPPSLYFKDDCSSREDTRCCVYNRGLHATLRNDTSHQQHHFQDSVPPACVVSTLGRRSKSSKTSHIQTPSASSHLPMTRMDPLKLLDLKRLPCSDGNSSSTDSGTPLPPLQRLPWYRSCEDLPSPPSSSSSSCPHHPSNTEREKRQSRCIDCNNKSDIMSIDRSNNSRYFDPSLTHHQTPTFETFSPPSPLPPARNPQYWI